LWSLGSGLLIILSSFITTYNNSLLQTLQLESQIASLQTSLQHSADLLAKLEKTNVYADAFCIGVDGPFGTINGLRFGRSGAVGSASGMPATVTAGPVDWSEVNAAWGLVVLCLKTIARKVGLKFDL
jgi:beclin